MVLVLGPSYSTVASAPRTLPLPLYLTVAPLLPYASHLASTSGAYIF